MAYSAHRLYSSTRLKVGLARQHVRFERQATGTTWRYLLDQARIRTARDQGPLSVQVADLGQVLVRPHSTDWGTIIGTVVEKYHRPVRPLPPDATIVDLGSNAGYTLLDFRALYPRARIIGVELDRGNFELASLKTSGHAIELLHAAVWIEDGVVRYSTEGDFNGFHVADLTTGEYFQEVPAVSIPSIMDSFSIASVDYLKMDIEGAEVEIMLSGDVSWLQKVRQISIEVHDNSLPLMIEMLRENGMTAIPSDRHWATAIGWRE